MRMPARRTHAETRRMDSQTPTAKTTSAFYAQSAASTDTCPVTMGRRCVSNHFVGADGCQLTAE